MHYKEQTTAHVCTIALWCSSKVSNDKGELPSWPAFCPNV